MPTRVYLIRHGATTLSAEDRFAGSTDVDLSAEGRAQAERLGERLAGETIAAVYSSPLRRAAETAAFVARPHGLLPVRSDPLREMDHGHWEGLRRSEVEERFGAEYSCWEADPFTFAPPGGEAGVSVLARALPFVREVVARHDSHTVALVSHKATIRLIVCAFLGMDARGYRDRLDQSPAGLNVFDFQGPVRARLVLLNDVSHYAPQPRPVRARLSRWFDTT